MYTPERIAKILQKLAETPEALKRNPLNRYVEGWFHITLNVREESTVLGRVVGDPDAADGSEDAPRCELTELGKAVENEWRAIGRFYPLCICEEIQVMPEHLHALLHLLPGNKGHLGRIVNGLMIGCTHHYWDTLGIDWRAMRKDIDESLKRYADSNDAATSKEKEKALRAEWQDRDHSRSFRGPALFVRGYNDVEAVNEEEIEIKRQYIRNNPRKRLITRSQQDCFRIMRCKHSPNWTVEVALRVLTADRFFSRNSDKREIAERNIMARLNLTEQSTTTQLDYLGSRALMASDRKLPLICHRADASRFEEQKTAVLDAARKGYVIVSAFISPKEREIRNQLLLELLPFIEIVDNGFSDRYKPVGKAFYACAENRLVQISCWRYEYARETVVSREMCLVMNQLARVISKREDDWWKKWEREN